MMRTTRENVRLRLSIRFLCLLLLGMLGGFFVFGPASVAPTDVIGLLVFLPMPLALLAPLLAVPNTYLCTLSLLTGAFHGALLSRSVLLVRAGEAGFLIFNAALFLTLFSLLLYALSAIKACHFAFEHPKRDIALIFTRDFLKYLTSAVLFTALSASVCFLWSRLLEKLPL
ncbi:MAG: hypothetical protein IJC99_02880 [Clostridia bacterium]|nr:hypothetical protein [Clostridia bacterium]